MARLPRGKPTKLTPQRRDKIIEGIEMGIPISIASTDAGISYQSHRNWYVAGQELRDKVDSLSGDEESVIELTAREKRLLDYFDKIKKAEATAAVTFHTTIYAAAVEDPTWAAWMLAHRFPDEYGAKVQVQGTGADGAIPVKIIEVVKDYSDSGDQPPGGDASAGNLREGRRPDTPALTSGPD